MNFLNNSSEDDLLTEQFALHTPERSNLLNIVSPQCKLLKRLNAGFSNKETADTQVLKKRTPDKREALPLGCAPQTSLSCVFQPPTSQACRDRPWGGRSNGRIFRYFEKPQSTEKCGRYRSSEWPQICGHFGHLGSFGV